MIIKTSTGKTVTIIGDTLIIKDKESEKNPETLDDEIEKIFNDIFGLKRKEK